MTIDALYALYRQSPSVQTDTRRLQPGDLFFALKGPSFDGNRFARQALDTGAAYAVIDDPAFKDGDRTILVDDVLTTLQQLALHHRRQFSIPVLAITGSNGKTTTKELIHAVLSRKFRTYTTEGNLNNHIGVPLTLLKIRPDAELAVIEMGANHQGEIASYCRYTEPTHGLITNVGKAHLEGFGGEEGVRKGKGELFDFIRAAGGTVFLMSDYGYLGEMSQGIGNTFSYGTSSGEIIGTIAQTDPFLEVAFQKGFEGTIRSSLVGAYNLPNLLAAVAVGVYFGVEAESIRAAIEDYRPSNSRSQLVQKGSTTIILDAYNANPSSMKAAIENFARLRGEKKILALGAMAELGPDSLKEHEAVVAEIGRYQWEAVVLVGGDFARIHHPYQQFASAAEAGPWLKERTEGAHLLVKGSRSMAMEKLLDYL
jgi:UDP-N-acetylmuramoyl-tripeptide--D-alanyl-D-alanine ligase